MERRRLAERQDRISEPNLYHEPGDRLNSPSLGGKRPERKQQAGETNGRNACKKYEFGYHRSERTTRIVVGNTSDMKERMPKAYRITTLLATKKKASLNSGCERTRK